MILNKIYHTLVGYRMRPDYWSCSETASQMQDVHGIPKKPKAGTRQQWAEWTKAAKAASPVGYWITEEGLGYLQDIANFVPDVYRNIRYKLKNIFISKSHVIPTGLELGEWHDANHRIQSGLFWMLVDFVEREKAHMNDWGIEDDEEIIDNRRDAGLAHLDWEISLADDSPLQSAAAKEIKEIYLWIKDVLPNRPDVYDVTGWSEYCDGLESPFDTEDEDDDTQKNVHQMLIDIANLEKDYEAEDTEMLIRIVKVRDKMWT